MAQNFFQCQHVHMALLVHHSGRRMAQFMGGISFSRKPGCPQATLYNLLHTARRKPFSRFFRNKQGLVILQIRQFTPLVTQARQCLHTSFIQIDKALFIAFANNAYCPIILDICDIDIYQFRKAHAAIQKQCNHAVIALVKIALHALKKLCALFQG